MIKPVLILMSCLMLSTALHAEIVVTYSIQDKSYFSLEIPDSWQVNVGTEIHAAKQEANENRSQRVITVMPDDGSILWFGVWVPVYVHDLDSAQEYLLSLDNFLLENPVLIKADQVDLNSMSTRYFKGKGERGGKSMDFFVMFFELSNEDIGIAIYIGPPDTTSTHLEELRAMMKSITPVRK